MGGGSSRAQVKKTNQFVGVNLLNNNTTNYDNFFLSLKKFCAQLQIVYYHKVYIKQWPNS